MPTGKPLPVTDEKDAEIERLSRAPSVADAARLDEMWSALKAQESIDPDKAVRIVMLTSGFEAEPLDGFRLIDAHVNYFNRGLEEAAKIADNMIADDASAEEVRNAILFRARLLPVEDDSSAAV